MSWRNAYLTGPSGKICAFCKHWYDPGNTDIRPKNIRMNWWEYDRENESVRVSCKFKRKSWQRCSKFESKL